MGLGGGRVMMGLGEGIEKGGMTILLHGNHDLLLFRDLTAIKSELHYGGICLSQIMIDPRAEECESGAAVQTQKKSLYKLQGLGPTIPACVPLMKVITFKTSFPLPFTKTEDLQQL